MTTGEYRTAEQPFAQKKYKDINGHRIAYIDEGRGPAIVFQHGNPTSSYLWRNVMPHVAGLGRLVAADFMGMGDSEKLDPSLGGGRYSFEEQRKYLHGLWDELDFGDEVILVLHDTGSMFGFDWANQHRERIQGIAYMESIVMPLEVEDFPAYIQEAIRNATPESMQASLQDLDFLEGLVLGTREFSSIEQAYYRKPFLIPGEDRRPMISFDLPLGGYPPHTTAIVDAYSKWLSESQVPKLLIKAEPGYLLKDRLYDFARKWQNQTEVSVQGVHYIQETTPNEVGVAVADFVKALRAWPGSPHHE